MTMTSGVGSPFYVAPEIIMNEKHYTSAVDVFSFGIMAAQVMVGRLVYDAEEFTTEYGLCSKLFFFTTNPTYPIMVFCDCCTAFCIAVCRGLRPDISGCSTQMKDLITSCWNANHSSRPCLSSFSLLTFFVWLFDCFHTLWLFVWTPAFAAIVDTLSSF